MRYGIGACTHSRRPGQARVASAEPGSITTNACDAKAVATADANNSHSPRAADTASPCPVVRGAGRSAPSSRIASREPGPVRLRGYALRRRCVLRQVHSLRHWPAIVAIGVDPEPRDIERRQEQECQQRANDDAAHHRVGHRTPENLARDRNQNETYGRLTA